MSRLICVDFTFPKIVDLKFAYYTYLSSPIGFYSSCHDRVQYTLMLNTFVSFRYNLPLSVEKSTLYSTRVYISHLITCIVVSLITGYIASICQWTICTFESSLLFRLANSTFCFVFAFVSVIVFCFVVCFLNRTPQW